MAKYRLRDRTDQGFLAGFVLLVMFLLVLQWVWPAGWQPSQEPGGIYFSAPLLIVLSLGAVLFRYFNTNRGYLNFARGFLLALVLVFMSGLFYVNR